MKAVVVSPSICDFYFTPGRAAALGAKSVYKLLKKKGVDCELINFPLMKPRGNKIPLPGSHKYLEPFIIPGERGALSYFNSFKIFGPYHNNSAKIVLSNHPDVIFISLFAWAYADDAILLAKEIRELARKNRRSVTICIGGAGVSVFPEFFKEISIFDYVLEGDAEISLPLFISELKLGKKKISYPKGINLNDPSPVLSLNVDSKEKQWVSMVLSRGCPLECKFCSNHLTQGRRFRATPVGSIIQEMDLLKISKDQPLHINLEDDNLLIRRAYFKRVLLMVKENYPQATFSIENGIDYTNLSVDFLRFLINVGFNSFTFSLGSFDPELLDNEGRPSNFSKFEKIINELKKDSIPVKTFLISGLPGDSALNVLNSLIYLHKLETEIGISLFYTVPGLPRFEDKKQFFVKSSRLCCGSAAYPWAKSLTTKELVTSFRLSRLSNFINKKVKTEQELNLLNIIKKEKKFYSFQGKSNEIVEIANLEDSMVKYFFNSIFN